MKYKILLAGKNQTTIDDFFYVMNDNFDCLTTSMRNEDIDAHLTYFKPHAFVYCIVEETRENILKIMNALDVLKRRHVKLILIGDMEPIQEFLRLKPDLVTMSLYKPIAAATISKELLKLFEEERALEEQKRMEEELERAKLEAELKANRTKNILIIDDDPMMLRTVKNGLKDKYNVATAVSGKIALTYLEKKTDIDVILLDYEMPVENGPKVFAKIRAMETMQDVPIVFLTGMNETEKIKQVLSLKPQGYLLKPIEFDKLMYTIEKVTD
ncbi:MAG: response regulator [Lachnospiraceae bacterium]|nr:response regulator [Lachnospiraceae bacterium]